MTTDWQNKLYFGDNLPILREDIAEESVDLIYLDPPFNSKATYNVLFKEQNGTDSPAQITAFDDFWHFDMEAARAYHEVVTEGPRKAADLLVALRTFLGQNDMMAYLTMMAIRLIEMHRILKPTGFLYLHCDPTASHYLKLVLDAVFGSLNYLNEISWRRTTTKGDYRQGAINYPRVRDVILYYAKDAKRKGTFHQPFAPYSKDYVDGFYRYEDENGRRYRLDNLAAPGAGTRGHPQYEFLGVTRYWRYNKEKMERLLEQGRIVQTKPGNVPAYKRYLDEMPGVAVGESWEDILPVQAQAKERLGYPTQKPEALLERIIKASSNEGDLVLDPFCGCGTTVAVAERLHRRWIGIDVTHLAISLMKSRLHDTFGPDLNSYQVIGQPEDLESAQALAEHNRYQFEYWALSLVDARPARDRKKGADKGIDGAIYFFDDESGKAKRIIVQVKSGHVSPTVVRDLNGVLDREKAQIGALVTLQEPTRAMREEAAAAGFYDPPSLLAEAPRIQVLTIEELLLGKRLEYPNVAPATFKQAARQTKAKPKGNPQNDLFE